MPMECPAQFVPVEVRQTGTIEGPEKSVPIRWLEIGLLKGLKNLYQVEG
jgi:hypothetical protein